MTFTCALSNSMQQMKKRKNPAKHASNKAEKENMYVVGSPF